MLILQKIFGKSRSPISAPRVYLCSWGLENSKLGGGFQLFFFHLYLGKWSNLTAAYISKWVGLEPPPSKGLFTLLGTNISPPKGILKMIVLFPFGGICDRSLEGILHSYMGVIINHYRDPYQTTRMAIRWNPEDGLGKDQGWWFCEWHRDGRSRACRWWCWPCLHIEAGPPGKKLTVFSV